MATMGHPAERVVAGTALDTDLHGREVVLVVQAPGDGPMAVLVREEPGTAPGALGLLAYWAGGCWSDGDDSKRYLSVPAALAAIAAEIDAG